MKLIKPEYLIKPEPAVLAGAVERLYDDVFGPARFHKASYLFREGVEPVRELSWIALEGDRLVGAIRYWSILVGESGHPALLLGPLAIAQDRAGKGIGRALMFKTLDLAAQLGHDLVLLVGDVDYYKRFGFVPATPHGFVMPGETRPDRLQVAPLKDNVLGRIAGEVRHLHSGLPAVAAKAARRAPRRARAR
ncbi:GNAT family N-acetyltransferase [Dongia deserti]|uniref:GNAT family N-acetyltransferase n=1 Tax=Dongia deserti TaxID=2268030 RepID=UPI000E64CB84|nr:N-acetyltransferase [Dongia deserti]